MDISLKHEDYKYLKAYKDSTVEEALEYEIILPEYMPEILRIVKTDACVQVHSCKASENKAIAEGVCSIRMTYTGEDNCLYTFEVLKPFARTLENNAFTDSADVIASSRVTYVNCKATSTRNAHVKTGIIIDFVAYASCNEDIISTSEEMNIEEKKLSVDTLSLGCRKTRSFSLSDNVALEKPGCFIVSVLPCAILTETRKINNKIMIKGDAIAEVCYVLSADKMQTETIRHIIPINQIMEFDGMEEHMHGDVALCVTATDVSVKGEAGGSFSGFDISLGIDVSVTMWEEKTVHPIIDAYAIGAAIELEKENYVFYDSPCVLNENYIFESSFSVAGEGVKQILNKSYKITDVYVKSDNGVITICGNLSLSLVIRDNGNSLSCVNKSLEFSFTHKNDKYNKNCSLTPTINIASLSCHVKGENAIDIRAEMIICGTVICERSVEVVKAIKESDKPFICNGCAITVYFPQKSNESLWSIARRYNTTVKAIAEENLLEGDTTENLKMIFIPSA